MTLPWAITTTQSLMPMTTSMSCSTKITVMPSSRSALMCPSSDCVRAGFTPAIGSSSITRLGSTMSARAISSSLRCPPERVPANSSRMWASLKRSSSSSARSSISRPPGAARPRARCAGRNRSPRWPGGGQHHVLDHGEPGQRLGELEGAHHAHAGDPVGRLAADRPALEGPRAGVGLVEAGEQVEERRLAGAVGPDQRGDRAALHLEVVDVDGDEAAEAARDPVDHEDRVGLGHPGAGPDADGRGRAAAAVSAQRTSSSISLRSPRIPCGPEDHQQHQPDADQGEPHGADVVAASSDRRRSCRRR